MQQLGTLVLLLACATPRLMAQPVFLETTVAGEPAGSLGVLAGGKVELILTLTAAEVIEPQLYADLSLVGGTLVAPLVKGARPELQRVGATQAGVQQFQFSIDVPAAEKPQKLVLNLRVKVGAAETWLPLPAVMLEVSPRTWKQALQQFVGRHASGRLAGSERLDLFFQEAGIEIPEAAADSPVETTGVQVWFADAQAEELRLPEAPAATVWLVFKKSVPGGVALRRLAPTGSLCLFVDEQALASADASATAQALLERALAFADALTTTESDLSPP